MTMQACTLSFTCTLSFDDGVECFEGVKLSQFTMHEVVDGVAVFLLRLPCPAVYRLIIYARHSELDIVSTDTQSLTLHCLSIGCGPGASIPMEQGDMSPPEICEGGHAW